MGGHSSSAPAVVQQPDNSGMIAAITSQEQAAQAAALAAQQAALLQAQQNSASNAVQQGNQNATQNLNNLNASQVVTNQGALSAAQAAAQAGGGSVTGGGFNLPQSRQAALTNLGGASGLPGTAANLAGSPQQAVNPAQTTSQSWANGNQFSAPNLSGIKFGGA